jgi:hypothetical protein
MDIELTNFPKSHPKSSNNSPGPYPNQFFKAVRNGFNKEPNLKW